jgi:high-affinity iron transporter
MLATAIIVFREVLEAALIVGIVLAATQGVPRRGIWVMRGIGAGVLGAVVVAGCAQTIAAASAGIGQEVFNAAVLFAAVAMLGWHNIWMTRHGRELTLAARQLGVAVRAGTQPLWAVSFAVGLAVLREGSEVVLFLYGIVVSSHTPALSLAVGGAGGLLLAACASFLLYRGLVAIPLHRLFSVTNGLIALLAAGMAGQAAAVLNAADLLPSWGNHVWDTSFLLADDGLVGRGLHALIGYSARPSGIQLAAYLTTLVVLIVASRAISRPGRRTLAAAVVTTALIAGAPAARADDLPTLVFRNHRFEPSRIEVPAHQKFKLQVKNADDTADEFESADLNREKLVTAGQTVTIFLGPLDPGEYKFFGDFHQDTARGVLVAK